MKKIIVISVLFLLCYSCNNSNKNNASDSSANTPSIDTAKGVNEGALNSNDTAAMRAVDPSNTNNDTNKNNDTLKK
ncbi:MAG TPA: hypothetical protein VH396_15075 [Chitinophagaceae bacterium]|jgi:hypothetical protein